jgi:hypothetical protein
MSFELKANLMLKYQPAKGCGQFSPRRREGMEATLAGGDKPCPQIGSERQMRFLPNEPIFTLRGVEKTPHETSRRARKPDLVNKPDKHGISAGNRGFLQGLTRLYKAAQATEIFFSAQSGIGRMATPERQSMRFAKEREKRE